MFGKLFEKLKMSEAQSKVELVKRLAALEHEQWMFWAKEILKSENISKERAARWEKLFVPYDELDAADKKDDTEWVRRVLAIIEE